MSTINISLSESLKSFVEDRVASTGYNTSSEYILELIRKDRDRQRLRALVLEGAASPPDVTADRQYFDRLRGRVLDARRR